MKDRPSKRPKYTICMAWRGSIKHTLRSENDGDSTSCQPTAECPKWAEEN